MVASVCCLYRQEKYKLLPLTQKTFLSFLMADLIYLLLLNISFLTGLRLRGGSRSRRQRGLHLSAICFWHFFFGPSFSWSKVQQYSVDSSLFFSVHCFFRAIYPRLCGRTCRVTNKMLNPGCFALRFLTVLVQGLSHTLLVGSIFLERLKGVWVLPGFSGPR